MTGHWEMMGINATKPFQTFTDTGFPKELLDELGEQEINEHKLIVYTSADSVLQICGNEETMGLEELYRCCKIARQLTLRNGILRDLYLRIL